MKAVRKWAYTKALYDRLEGIYQGLGYKKWYAIFPGSGSDEPIEIVFVKWEKGDHDKMTWEDVRWEN